MSAVCPEKDCDRQLFDAVGHCEYTDGRSPCGWVKCRCGSVIDTVSGRHYRVPAQK